jgi:hypothetical protein
MRDRGMRAVRALAGHGRRITTTAGAAVLAAGLLGAGAANAATAAGPGSRVNGTPACGANCFTLYSRLLGSGTVMNAYVPGDTGTGGQVGQDVTLKYASNSHPNQDFTDFDETDGIPLTVKDFCQLPPSSPQSFNPESYVCRNYRGDDVLEFDWSPYGNETGLCAGVPSARNGENVTLRPCGETDGTLWIIDSANCSPHVVVDGRYNAPLVTYAPLINGSDPSFSHPLVLTVDAGSAQPGNQLKLDRENVLKGGTIRDSQMFALTGSLHDTCTPVILPPPPPPT